MFYPIQKIIILDIDDEFIFLMSKRYGTDSDNIKVISDSPHTMKLKLISLFNYMFQANQLLCVVNKKTKIMNKRKSIIERNSYSFGHALLISFNYLRFCIETLVVGHLTET